MPDRDDNHRPNKIYFEKSSIETIDQSMMNYLKELNLFSQTNTGWKKVPVLWGSAERSFQVKSDKDIRDNQGMLKLPLITLSRTSFTKSKQNRGAFQGFMPEHTDEQGGSFQMERVIYQEKTKAFANAEAFRQRGQHNYPMPNQKIVYRSVSIPMPVNVEVSYEIAIRTEYQQQMNKLMLPFVVKPGRINAIVLKQGVHRYEGFIEESFAPNNNVSDFTSDERKFETKINVKVVAYLMGEGENREKPHFAVRENAVDVKIPRERLTLSEIPEHEYGRYYGLSGLPLTLPMGSSMRDFLFNNIPASSGLTATGEGGASGTVTKDNFREILAESFVFRELLKAEDTTWPAEKVDDQGRPTLTTTNSVKANTEALYINGMIQAVGASAVSPYDYSISGNTITLTQGLNDSDSVYITYIIN